LRSWYSAAAAVAEPVPAKSPPPPPPPASAPVTPITLSTPTNEDKAYPPKLVNLVDQIAGLTLLEVADLNELLKKTLKIPDMPMMGAMTMAAPAPVAAEEEEAAAPAKIQTSFTVKLLKFDEGKKVALIKEVKSLLEGMNLVQAKKFVESAPTIVKADIAQGDAEKLAEALTAAGGTCEVV